MGIRKNRTTLLKNKMEKESGLSFSDENISDCVFVESRAPGKHQSQRCG